MTLAQVQAAVALVTALMLTWSGLMIAVALLVPDRTKRAEQAIVESTARRVWLGLAGLLAGIASVALFSSPNGLVKALGALLAALVLVSMTLGAAGLSRLLASRISEASGGRSEFGALVCGSLVFSLAGFFPGIGWYLFGPIAIVISLGAGIPALLPDRRPAPPSSAPIPDAGAA